MAKTQPEAALDVTSPVYGFLPPRVSLTSLGTASPIKNPKTDDFALATGTMVYHDGTNGIAPGYYYWNGSSWQNIGFTATSDQAWTLSGNSGTSAPGNFIGTRDNYDFSVKTNDLERIRISNTGNAGFGTTTPTALIHLRDGHLKSEQTVLPTITGDPAASFVITDRDPTDTRGTVSIGGSGPNDESTATITFAKPYNIPPLVVLTLATAPDFGKQNFSYMYVTSDINSFTIHFFTSADTSNNPHYIFNYFVME